MRRAITIDPPPAFARDDEIVGGAEELVDADIERALPQRLVGMHVRHESRVHVGGRPRWFLQIPDQLSRTIHGPQAGQVASQVRCQPHERLRHELGASREGIDREDLHHVREPTNRFLPALRRGEGRSVIGRRHQHCVAKPKPIGTRAVYLGVFDEAAQHQAAARVRDDVVPVLALWQAAHELPGVLLGRATHGKVIEGVDPVAVQTDGHDRRSSWPRAVRTHSRRSRTYRPRTGACARVQLASRASVAGLETSPSLP